MYFIFSGCSYYFTALRYINVLLPVSPNLILKGLFVHCCVVGFDGAGLFATRVFQDPMIGIKSFSPLPFDLASRVFSSLCNFVVSTPLVLGCVMASFQESERGVLWRGGRVGGHAFQLNLLP